VRIAVKELIIDGIGGEVKYVEGLKRSEKGNS